MKHRSKSTTPPRIAGTKAVTRALRITRTFTDAHPEWSLAALAREGMVVRNDATGAYRLGPAAIELGARAQRSNSITVAARPELERLTRATGETSSIEILSGDETVILDEVQGGHLIGTSPAVGTRWPAHATSTGKVLLAAGLEGDPAVIQQMTRRTGGKLRRLTPCTIGTAARLTTELVRVSRQGYATAIGELEVGYVAIGWSSWPARPRPECLSAWGTPGKLPPSRSGLEGRRQDRPCEGVTEHGERHRGG